MPYFTTREKGIGFSKLRVDFFQSCIWVFNCVYAKNRKNQSLWSGFMNFSSNRSFEPATPVCGYWNAVFFLIAAGPMECSIHRSGIGITGVVQFRSNIHLETGTLKRTHMHILKSLNSPASLDISPIYSQYYPPPLGNMLLKVAKSL